MGSTETHIILNLQSILTFTLDDIEPVTMFRYHNSSNLGAWGNSFKFV